MKMVWRVTPAHKRVQQRMDNMRQFRHQHEQLRTVIVRVLRPNLLMAMASRHSDAMTPPALPEAGDAESKPDPIAMEAADANAIEVRYPTIDSHVQVVLTVLYAMGKTEKFLF